MCYKMFVVYFQIILVVAIQGTFSTSTSQSSSCSTTTFLDHGLRTKGKGFYRTFPETNIDNCRNECENENMCRDFQLGNGECRLSASDITAQSLTSIQCQDSCMNDDYCVGYTYHGNNQNCKLSNDPNFDTDSPCGSCIFYEKTCQSYSTSTIQSSSPCSTTSFLDHGLQTEGKGFYRTFPETDMANCRNECDGEFLCRDFQFANGNCRLSASDITTQSVTFDQCQGKCIDDGICVGYTYNTNNQNCKLSNDKNPLTTGCPSCHFYEMTCQSSSTSTSLSSFPCPIPSFLDHGFQTEGKGFYRTFPETDMANCRNECDGEYLCRDFQFANGNCRLSASDISPQSLTFDQCQGKCIDDGNCVGYTYNTNNQNCKLSNAKDPLTTGCPSCHFYELTCQSYSTSTIQSSSPCSTTSFLDHGLQTEGKGFYRTFPETDMANCKKECDGEYLCRDFHFANGNCRLSASDTSPQSLTFDQCKKSCIDDGICVGYTYNTNYKNCKLSNDKDPLTTGCPSCHFYELTCQSYITTPPPKSCLNMTFLDHGQYTKAKSFYNTSPGHNVTTCKASCETDSICRAFRIESETCKLSPSDLTPSVVSFEQCKMDCTNDETCYGYAYDEDIQRCTLSNVRIHGEAPNRDSSHFYEKNCRSDYSEPPCDGTTSFYHHGIYYRNELILHETTAPSLLHCENMCLQETQCRDIQYNSTLELCRMNAADFRFKSVGSLTECEFLCAVDSHCVSYFFKADDKKCRLSNSNVSLPSPFCKYCMFSSRECSKDAVLDGDLTTNSYNITTHLSMCYTYQSSQTAEYSYDPDQTVSTWTECEDQCSNDQDCKGYSYDAGGSNTCLLSPSHQSVPGCSTCFFVLKHACEITTASAPSIPVTNSILTESRSSDISSLFHHSPPSTAVEFSSSTRLTSLPSASSATYQPTYSSLQPPSSSSGTMGSASSSLSLSLSSFTSASTMTSESSHPQQSTSATTSQFLNSSTSSSLQSLSTITMMPSISTPGTISSPSSVAEAEASLSISETSIITDTPISTELTSIKIPSTPPGTSPSTTAVTPYSSIFSLGLFNSKITTSFSTSSHPLMSTSSTNILPQSNSTNYENKIEATTETVTSILSTSIAEPSTSRPKTSSSFPEISPLSSLSTEMQLSHEETTSSPSSDSWLTTVLQHPSTAKIPVATNSQVDIDASSSSNSHSISAATISSYPSSPISTQSSISSSSSSSSSSAAAAASSSTTSSSSTATSTAATASSSKIIEITETNFFSLDTNTVSSSLSSSSSPNSQLITTSIQISSSPQSSFISSTDTTIPSTSSTSSTHKTSASTIQSQSSFQNSLISITRTISSSTSSAQSSLRTSGSTIQSSSIASSNQSSSPMTSSFSSTSSVLPPGQSSVATNPFHGQTTVPFSSMPHSTMSYPLSSLPLQSSMEPSPVNETEVVQITNGTVQCVCICRENNLTVQETITLRKQALSVAKKNLSSAVRRLTSAPDDRPSSTAIGSIGATIISFLVALFILPDVMSGFYLFHKVLKEYEARNEKKLSYKGVTKV